jgi:hypothetical protein
MKIKLYFLLFLVIFQQIFAQSDYYWINGTGDWSDLNHWRIGSSTGPQATIIPSRYDNVFITNSSGFTATMGLSPAHRLFVKILPFRMALPVILD